MQSGDNRDLRAPGRAVLRDDGVPDRLLERPGYLARMAAPAVSTLLEEHRGLGERPAHRPRMGDLLWQRFGDSLAVRHATIRGIVLARTEVVFVLLHVSLPSVFRPCGRHFRPGVSQTISPSLNITTVRPAAAASRRTRSAARSKAAPTPARPGPPSSPGDVRSCALTACLLRLAAPGCCPNYRTASTCPPDHGTRSQNCAILWKSVEQSGCSVRRGLHPRPGGRPERSPSRASAGARRAARPGSPGFASRGSGAHGRGRSTWSRRRSCLLSARVRRSAATSACRPGRRPESDGRGHRLPECGDGGGCAVSFSSYFAA